MAEDYGENACQQKIIAFGSFLGLCLSLSRSSLSSLCLSLLFLCYAVRMKCTHSNEMQSKTDVLISDPNMHSRAGLDRQGELVEIQNYDAVHHISPLCPAAHDS